MVFNFSELGRQQREELLAKRILREAGYKVKQEYMQKGKITRDEKQVSSLLWLFLTNCVYFSTEH